MLALYLILLDISIKECLIAIRLLCQWEYYLEDRQAADSIAACGYQCPLFTALVFVRIESEFRRSVRSL
jgi:hypothetical protein